MIEILCSPQHQPSSSSSIDNDVLQLHQQQAFINHDSLINSSSSVALYRTSTHIIQQEVEETGEGDQLSVLAALLTVFRKSLVGCRSISGESCGVEEKLMEIGRPSDVRHVAHVTFDRFDGFLGLPVEFEPEVPRRPPSASTRVFGVSTESMQLSFDSRGNCVPTTLLMMQRRLYSQGGLQSEGIFRINPENSQEEYVREQLNNGYIPENIDVHCLAGLIKAWFRELPTGLLDSLSPERVMEAQSEEECTQLVRLLPPTETALLDWAINLMADVAQMENHNKMNARNIAMVFAPNMTQMSDPLTALMYAVQVMNFLKTLIAKTLREREEPVVDSGPVPRLEPSDEDGHPSTLKPINIAANEFSEEEEANMVKEPLSNHINNSASLAETMIGNKSHRFLKSTENIIADENVDACYYTPAKSGVEGGNIAVGSGRSTQPRSRRTKSDHLSNLDNTKKGSRKYVSQPAVLLNGTAEKSKELSVISRVNSHSDRVESGGEVHGVIQFAGLYKDLIVVQHM